MEMMMVGFASQTPCTISSEPFLSRYVNMRQPAVDMALFPPLCMHVLGCPGFSTSRGAMIQ